MEAMYIASIYLGLFLGIFVFTFSKTVQQTRLIWRRTKTLNNIYLYLIWGEALVNLVFAIFTYLFLDGVIPGSVGFYVFLVALWAIQTQILPQIIANRISLIMTNRQKARNLKMGLAISIGAVNIAVFYIWTTGHMATATPAQVKLNYIFERVEKSFFLILDLSLNLYFLYMVRYRLIAEGLTKYWRLFKFNVAIVLLSTSMDVLLLGFLNFSDPYLYVQFAPVAYIVKLHIELLMAVLISKVVRGGASGQEDWAGTSGQKSNPTNHVTSRVVITGAAATKVDEEAREGSTSSEVYLKPYPGDNGIVRTVETTVTTMVDEDPDSASM